MVAMSRLAHRAMDDCSRPKPGTVCSKRSPTEPPGSPRLNPINCDKLAMEFSSSLFSELEDALNGSCLGSRRESFE